MIDLGKHKLLLATAILPCAFGITSCSTTSAVNDDAAVVSQEEVIVVEKQRTVELAVPEDTAPYYSYNAPVGGGSYAEQVPYNALGERYGNAGEDMASSVPSPSIGSDMSLTAENTADCIEDKFQLSAQAPASNLASGEIRVVAPAPASAVAGGAVDENAQATTLRGATEGEVEQAVPVEDWLAPEGASLRSLLMDWSDRSGWKVVWKSDREYILEAGAVFRGRYMDVTSALVRTFARARPAPIATFYKGNMVLLITTLEDENAD